MVIAHLDSFLAWQAHDRRNTDQMRPSHWPSVLPKKAIPDEMSISIAEDATDQPELDQVGV